jgi:hypothetical protein
MIYTAISVLLFCLFFVAFLQPSAPRFFAAVTFVSITLFHEFALSDWDGLAYYSSAAFFALAIIGITSGINPIPKMVINLHKICLASILLNFFGWFLWFFYFPPLLYNLAYIILYAGALFIMLDRRGDDVGDFALDSWRSCIRFDTYPGHFYFFKRGSKT